MTHRKLQFKIVTPEKMVYSDQVNGVTIPTQAGEITVLAHHVPLVSILQPGELRIQKDDQIVFMAVSTGFVEMRPDNQLYILADTAERAEEIDYERAQQARQRAQAMLEHKQDQADVDFARLQAVLNREIARVKVVSKYKRRNK